MDKKKIENLITQNKIFISECSIGTELYYLGHKFKVINDCQIKHKNFIINSAFAFKDYIELDNKDLTDWVQDHFIRGLKLTKEQIIDNINFLEAYEISVILNIYDTLTEQDYEFLIEENKNFLYILLRSKFMLSDFWQKHINKLIIQDYISYLIESQKLNDKFIKTNLNLFTKQDINDILKYQKENISDELKNELNILYKIIN